MEMVWDPEVDMAIHNSVLMPWQEVVEGDMPWLEWVKEVTQMEGLFVYFSRMSQRYTLAGWLRSPDEGLCPVYVDLEAFDGPAVCGGWPKGLLMPEVLVDRLMPTEDAVDRSRRLRKEAWRRREAEREATLEARTSALEWAKKKGIPVASSRWALVSDDRKKEWMDFMNLTQKVSGTVDRSL